MADSDRERAERGTFPLSGNARDNRGEGQADSRLFRRHLWGMFPALHMKIPIKAANRRRKKVRNAEREKELWTGGQGHPTPIHTPTPTYKHLDYFFPLGRTDEPTD